MLYDGILRLGYVHDTSAVAYADDLALICEANTEDMTEDVRVNTHLAAAWLQRIGFKLEPTKTDIAILKWPRKRYHVTFQVQRDMIKPKRTV